MFTFLIKKQKINILIPIGRFSFFAQACLKNIQKTTLKSDSIRVTYLASNNLEPHISDIISKEDCDLIKSPFCSNSNHLQLLDWAIREANISEWFLTQHCDLIWKKSGWLQEFKPFMNCDNILICPFNWSNYSYNDTRMNTAGDFLGAYNRQKLIENELKFDWGRLGFNCKVSKTLNEEIKSNKIKNIITGRNVEDGEFMDGSQALTWEVYVNSPQSIKILHINDYYDHLLSIFRIADLTKWNEDTIEIDYNWAPFGSDLWLKIFSAYSYLTTFLFDKNEVNHIALPWGIFASVVKQIGLDLTPHLINLQQLDVYKGKYETLGSNHREIKSLRFGNVVIRVGKKNKIFI